MQQNVFHHKYAYLENIREKLLSHLHSSFFYDLVATLGNISIFILRDVFVIIVSIFLTKTYANDLNIFD